MSLDEGKNRFRRFSGAGSRPSSRCCDHTNSHSKRSLLRWTGVRSPLLTSPTAPSIFLFNTKDTRAHISSNVVAKRLEILRLRLKIRHKCYSFLTHKNSDICHHKCKKFRFDNPSLNRKNTPAFRGHVVALRYRTEGRGFDS